MASSLLALLDDIATVLDDVAVMTKVAAKKTAGAVVLCIVELIGKLRRKPTAAAANKPG